jgi:hypothetical protein
LRLAASNFTVFEVGADYMLAARDDGGGESHLIAYRVRRGPYGGLQHSLRARTPRGRPARERHLRAQKPSQTESCLRNTEADRTRPLSSRNRRHALPAAMANRCEGNGQCIRGTEAPSPYFCRRPSRKHIEPHRGPSKSADSITLIGTTVPCSGDQQMDDAGLDKVGLAMLPSIRPLSRLTNAEAGVS